MWKVMSCVMPGRKTPQRAAGVASTCPVRANCSSCWAGGRVEWKLCARSQIRTSEISPLKKRSAAGRMPTPIITGVVLKAIAALEARLSTSTPSI